MPLVNFVAYVESVMYSIRTWQGRYLSVPLAHTDISTKSYVDSINRSGSCLRDGSQEFQVYYIGIALANSSEQNGVKILKTLF